MDNGLDNMLDMYLFETNTLLEQLDELLLEAESQDYFSADQINEIFRIMHTIKGSSAMMQFNSLMTVAHRIEDMFFVIRENGSVEEKYSQKLFNLMFKASDFLKAQVAIIEGGGSEEESADDIVSEIEHLLAVMKGEAADETPVEALAADETIIPDEAPSDALAHSNSGLSVQLFFDQGSGMESLRAIMLLKSIAEVCNEQIVTIPPGVEATTEITQHIIEHGLTISFGCDEDFINGLEIIKQDIYVDNYEILVESETNTAAPAKAEEVKDMEQKDNTAGIKKPEIKEETKPTDGKDAKKEEKHDLAKHSKTNLINVNLSKLDSLMALVGELVITQSMVTSSSDLKDLKLDNFTKSARQLRKLTTELQDIVMSVRMVPVAGVFQKMNRIVRDMGQKLGKEVQLVTIGNDTEIDKTIVDSIQDPLMHIVRNSMDHGIESDANDRIAFGKPKQGTITLKAEHTGSEVIITISDDGRGMDPDKILASAKEKGLLTKPESEYTKKEILQLTLLPGFSTKTQVTEFSGRGVGMDVVTKNIEKVGGTVYISSEMGEGTVTTFKIPLTLAIIDGMECRVSDYQFTIPIANIRQSFKATKEDIINDAARGEMIQRGDEFITLVRLNHLYKIDGGIDDIEEGIIMWVEFAGISYCLLVDELIGQHQVVVKPLPLYFGAYNLRDFGITGCTILGDGNISIILDVPNIFNFATGRLDSRNNGPKDASLEEENSETNYIAEEKIDSLMLKLLTFTVGEKPFAINTDNVMEIINVFTITQFPLLPDYIKGVINLRGQIIPVLDMRLKLGNHQSVDMGSMKSCIIILEVNSTTLGILVDEVFLVADVEKTAIAPPPANNKHDLITGIVEIEEMVHLIFDLSALTKVA
ncbi:MAG: chemotaxis protein CheA [Clostridiales bacterium]|jgi:two-component system chemotaxis sensor kinase CheA|nr:chemotaxis protein CheA [Clostridiales bacterium]